MTQAPSRKQINRWRRYLANERAEAAVYRELARNRTGEEREILLSLADAESRHESYWHDRLGDQVGMPIQPGLNTRIMAFMARHFGSVFVLALMQSAESDNPYLTDDDAPDAIAADERMHAEVVRALASQGRERISGGFRAAIFGANDGLVSNVALVLGVMGTGMPANAVLLTGISGLLAGALSMAAGEFISVRSQYELLEASTPNPDAHTLIDQVDVNANELALVFRARGLSAEDADKQAQEVFARTGRTPAEALTPGAPGSPGSPGQAVESEASRESWTAAGSSFLSFGIGAFIPIIPFILGMEALPGAVVSLVLVSVALMFTGAVTGLLSGKPPLPRALRQLAIGLGAAGLTYLLGMLFGTVVG